MRANLRRHVGTEDADLARLGLDEADVVVGAQAAFEHARELEERRRDDAITAQRKAIEEASRQVAPALRFLGQEEFPHPGRSGCSRVMKSASRASGFRLRASGMLPPAEWVAIIARSNRPSRRLEVYAVTPSRKA